MKSSLREIQKSEAFISGRMPTEEALLYEAQVLTNPFLRWNLHFLKLSFRILKLYHRKKLKEEAEAVHQDLFASDSTSELKKRIQNLFL